MPTSDTEEDFPLSFNTAHRDLSSDSEGPPSLIYVSDTSSISWSTDTTGSQSSDSQPQTSKPSSESGSDTDPDPPNFIISLQTRTTQLSCSESSGSDEPGSLTDISDSSSDTFSSDDSESDSGCLRISLKFRHSRQTRTAPTKQTTTHSVTQDRLTQTMQANKVSHYMPNKPIIFTDAQWDDSVFEEDKK